MNCLWCQTPMTGRFKKYCSQRCRQAAWRLRTRCHLEASQSAPKRLAYADPPYPGNAAKYYSDEATYVGEVDHKRLLEQLATYDGWALSTSAKALRNILPLCSEEVRVCAWVKPIGASSRTYGLHSTWEPLIVSPARSLRPGHRDWILAQPARFGGELMGRKPIRFCAFLFQTLGAAPNDRFYDLFPGTGIVSSAWRAFVEGSLTASDADVSDCRSAPAPTPGGSVASSSLRRVATDRNDRKEGDRESSHDLA